MIVINSRPWALGLLSLDDHHTPELLNVKLEKGRDLQVRLSFDQQLGLTLVLWSLGTLGIRQFGGLICNIPSIQRSGEVLKSRKFANLLPLLDPTINICPEVLPLI
jgi:hypothetical protein